MLGCRPLRVTTTSLFPAGFTCTALTPVLVTSITSYLQKLSRTTPCLKVMRMTPLPVGQIWIASTKPPGLGSTPSLFKRCEQSLSETLKGPLSSFSNKISSIFLFQLEGRFPPTIWAHDFLNPNLPPGPGPGPTVPMVKRFQNLNLSFVLWFLSV